MTFTPTRLTKLARASLWVLAGIAMACVTDIHTVQAESDTTRSSLASAQESILENGLPFLFLVIIIMLFVLAVNTFGKRENYLEKQVSERTRHINLKNAQILNQAEALNEEKEKLDRVNAEMVLMLGKLEENIEKLSEQRVVIEDNNRKILDSIRYAKRIQRSILPSHDSLQEVFPDSFVFYQAKDIVSGDFYFSTKKMGKIFLAAVDCTGHGVPGAFMSLIAHNQLTRAINEYGILEPARILLWADKGLSSLLGSIGEGGDQGGDGMEIGLLAIDHKKRTLEYAGAHRPLYRITNGDLIEYRGEPFSIGPVQQAFEVEKRFANHTIPMVEGDMYYLFSDGFVSQFSGESGKKFMTARFKKLLLSICHLPIDEQKSQLYRAYEEWRGDATQIDDLLVMGIRVALAEAPTLKGLSKSPSIGQENA
jgi:serine phosphatase RsbU (regulator of sigma subunit)